MSMLGNGNFSNIPAAKKMVQGWNGSRMGVIWCIC